MAQPNAHSPRQYGVEYTPYQLVAAAANTSKNSIPALTKVAVVTGVTTNADDWIVLPPLNSCPNGHEIKILCSAGGNFELRTPTSSNEEINSEDCDATKEYLCTDTEVLTVVKINNTIGWAAWSYTAIGAKTTAVVPD